MTLPSPTKNTPTQRGAGDARPAPPQPGKDLPLPHDVDESIANVATAPDPVIQQAKRDLDAGLVDTDMRVTPGLDAALRRKMVPGAGGRPPPTGGDS